MEEAEEFSPKRKKMEIPNQNLKMKEDDEDI